MGGSVGSHLMRQPLPLPGLPFPEVNTTVLSSTGSGESNCLGLDFPGETDSLRCEVGVVMNLVTAPNITWLQGDNEVSNTNGSVLVYGLPSSEGGAFTCEACVTVEAANITDHCSEETVEITGEGTFSSVVLGVSALHQVHLCSVQHPWVCKTAPGRHSSAFGSACH